MVMVRPTGKQAELTRAFMKHLEKSKGPRVLPSQDQLRAEPKPKKPRPQQLRDNLP